MVALTQASAAKGSQGRKPRKTLAAHFLRGFLQSEVLEKFAFWRGAVFGEVFVRIFVQSWPEFRENFHAEVLQGDAVGGGGG